MNITDAYILLLYIITSTSIVYAIDRKIDIEDIDSWYVLNIILTLVFLFSFTMTNYSLSNESTTYYDENYENSKNKDLIYDIISHKGMFNDIRSEGEDKDDCCNSFKCTISHLNSIYNKKTSISNVIIIDEKRNIPYTIDLVKNDTFSLLPKTNYHFVLKVEGLQDRIFNKYHIKDMEYYMKVIVDKKINNKLYEIRKNN